MSRAARGARCRGTRAGGALVATGLALVVAVAAAAAPTRPAAGASLRAGWPRRAAFGTWAPLGHTTVDSTPTLYEDAARRVTVLWEVSPLADEFTYDAAVLAHDGAVVSRPTSIFGRRDWAVLSDAPTLLGHAGRPLLVFEGQQGSSPSDRYALGCVVGAIDTPSGWMLEPWTLSASCNSVPGGAAISPGGTLAAAWPNGTSVQYHVGTSSHFPASSPDGTIDLVGAGAQATQASVVDDAAGGGGFAVVWIQYFSASHDGYYVEGLGPGAAQQKAPGSGTTSANVLPEAVPAVASTSTHPGVYLAYCTNTSLCRVLLWRVGAATATLVPGSAGADDTALSAGPDGRLWVAWFDRLTEHVLVVRTDRVDRAFGAPHVLATPCRQDGLLGLTAGSDGEVTVALECENLHAQTEVYATQVEVALTLAVPTSLRAGARRVAVRVTDVGDPVAGATVRLLGRVARTDARGVAVVALPASTAPGTDQVTATAPGYVPARRALRVD